MFDVSSKAQGSLAIDCETTAIRLNGFTIKIKNRFIKENNNCAALLHCDKIMVKVIITNGSIDEYENLPVRLDGWDDDNTDTAAWLFRKNTNIPMRHKILREG